MHYPTKFGSDSLNNICEKSRREFTLNEMTSISCLTEHDGIMMLLHNARTKQKVRRVVLSHQSRHITVAYTQR